jgi:hypothetical protein
MAAVRRHSRRCAGAQGIALSGTGEGEALEDRWRFGLAEWPSPDVRRLRAGCQQQYLGISKACAIGRIIKVQEALWGLRQSTSSALWWGQSMP